MSTPRQYLVGAIVAALAIPVGVAGCSAQPSDDAVTGQIQASILREVPHVTGAVTDLGHDGTARTVVVRLYLDSAEPTVVASAVEKAVGLAWSGTSTMPSSVIISAVDGSEPSGASTSDLGGIDLATTAATLGFPVPGVGRDRLIVNARALAEHYGSWQSK